MYVGWWRFNFCKILYVTSTKMSTNDICNQLLNTLALHSKLIRKGQKNANQLFKSKFLCRALFQQFRENIFFQSRLRSFTNKKPAKLVVSSKNVERICILILWKLISFSTKKILGEKNHLIFIFFNILKCYLNMAIIIEVLIRAKKTCDQRNHTYRKVDDPWEIKISSFSTRTTLSAASQYLLLSSLKRDFLMRFWMSAAGGWPTPESSWPELTGTEPFLNQLGWLGRRGKYPCKNVNHAGQHWAFSFGYLYQAHRYQIISSSSSSEE